MTIESFAGAAIEFALGNLVIALPLDLLACFNLSAERLAITGQSPAPL